MHALNLEVKADETFQLQALDIDALSDVKGGVAPLIAVLVVADAFVIGAIAGYVSTRDSDKKEDKK